MNDAQREAALREVKRLRKMAADLAGQAEGLEELLLAAEPEGVAAVDYAGGKSPAAETVAAVDYAIGQSPAADGVYAGRQEGKKAVDWRALAGRDLTDAVALGRKAEELLAEIVRVYSGFDRVRAIAVGQSAWEARVYVLVEMDDHYDDDLIGVLLEAEDCLHAKFDPLCLYMHYPPVGEEIFAEKKYGTGTIIWRRGVGESE